MAKKQPDKKKLPVFEVLSEAEKGHFESLEIDTRSEIDKNIKLNEIRIIRAMQEIKELRSTVINNEEIKFQVPPSSFFTYEIEESSGSTDKGGFDSETVKKQNPLVRIDELERRISDLQKQQARLIDLRMKVEENFIPDLKAPWQ